MITFAISDLKLSNKHNICEIMATRKGEIFPNICEITVARKREIFPKVRMPSMVLF